MGSQPRRSFPWLGALPLALVLATAGCRSDASHRAPAVDGVESIRETLDVLYESFGFDAGGEADWSTMRSLFLEGASFVAPIREGTPPRAVDADTFLAEFAAWIATSPRGKSGFHERIERARIDVFGNIAHAYVLFAGYVPGDAGAETRGIDSLQLVRDGQRWLVASFTTQYANEELPVPARFDGRDQTTRTATLPLARPLPK